MARLEEEEGEGGREGMDMRYKVQRWGQREGGRREEGGREGGREGGGQTVKIGRR